MTSRSRCMRSLGCSLLLTILSSACSFQSRPPLSAELAAMHSNAAIKQWQISGKIGIRSEQQSESAYLNWQQCGEYYDIRLSGPLGQGAARLRGSPQQVSLKTSKQVSHADNPEQLLQQQLGWSIPVTQLFYWVRGIPSPAHSYRSSSDNSGFEQAGWHISYQRLQQVDGITLPAKAIARHPRLKVTLLLKNWQLSPDCSWAP